MTDKHRRFLGPVVEMRKLHDSAEQRIVHSAEMLDRKSLASVGDTTGERLTALLTETKAHTPEELAANVARIGELLGRFALYVPARFTDDPAEQAKYWAVRSGIFPAVGGSRPAGTTCLSEDVAFHIEDLPRATAELQALIALTATTPASTGMPSKTTTISSSTSRFRPRPRWRATRR